MTPADLKEKLGDPKLIVLDVRSSGDWNGSPIKIKGAVRVDSKRLSAARGGGSQPHRLRCAVRAGAVVLQTVKKSDGCRREYASTNAEDGVFLMMS